MAVLELTRRKAKGDLAEMAVAKDLVGRGYRIAFPYGEDCLYDLILDRGGGRFDRIQVKYACSDGDIVEVRCATQSLTNGKVMNVTRYTAEMIEWLAVYDVTTDTCYYVPAAELAEGRRLLHLRLTPTRNNQQQGIRWAADYREI